jgi:hypothetical protein
VKGKGKEGRREGGNWREVEETKEGRLKEGR